MFASYAKDEREYRFCSMQEYMKKTLSREKKTEKKTEKESSTINIVEER